MSDYDKLWRLLAHTDLGSLPNDWTLLQIAEARINDLVKLRAENARLREALEWMENLDPVLVEAAKEKFALASTPSPADPPPDQSASWSAREP